MKCQMQTILCPVAFVLLQMQSVFLHDTKGVCHVMCRMCGVRGTVCVFCQMQGVNLCQTQALHCVKCKVCCVSYICVLCQKQSFVKQGGVLYQIQSACVYACVLRRNRVKCKIQDLYCVKHRSLYDKSPFNT